LKGVYLLFYHAQSPVTTRKEAVKQPIHHEKASTSVKPPTANVKPNLTAVNITTRNSESLILWSSCSG